MDISTRGVTCCLTGHRPIKLPWRYNEADIRCRQLKKKLCDVIDALYRAGIVNFITGMAQGCDTYFAEAVIRLREIYSEITLEAAVPCEGQEKSWSLESRKRYNEILAKCDKVTLMQKEHTPECMLLRNQYMVDHSSVLIAVFDGTSGGTLNTVNYARQQGVEIIQIIP